MVGTVQRFIRDEAGTTAIEYAIIAGFLSVAIVTVVGEIGEDVVSLFELVKSGFQG